MEGREGVVGGVGEGLARDGETPMHEQPAIAASPQAEEEQSAKVGSLTISDTSKIFMWCN